MRYVLQEDRDELEQRCLDSECGFVNPVFEEPRRNCARCQGPLGAYRAYGTPAQRAERLTQFESSIRDYAG